LDSTELEAKDENGCTAFLRACAHGNVDCIVTLAEAGCDTAARNRTGRTGLMLAAGWGSAAAIQALLELDSTELEAKDEQGCTAFLCACTKGNVDCIGALAEAGCDTFVKGAFVTLNGRPIGTLRRSATTDSVCAAVALLTARVAINEDGLSLSEQNATVVSTVVAIAGAHLIQQVARARELAADTADDDGDCCARAIACLEQAIKDYGASPEATELQDELRERLQQQREEAERKAKQAEAELMAMIEGGEQPAAAGDAKVENARKKKQKRQRQKAQAAAATNGPSLEPQTAPLLSNIASSTTMEAEKARKKKEKRKRQQEKKAAKRAAETSVPEPGMESGSQTRSSSPPMPALAQEPQPMPQPQPPAPERPGLQPQSEAPPSPAAESTLPLAQLTVEQSVAWLGTVSGLAPDTIEAVGRTFTEHEIDGQELQLMRPKLLRGFLKVGLPDDAETRDGAIAAILARRDQQLVAESKPGLSKSFKDCMVCPLSLCLMNDPWTTQVGSTCE
jgi:hypothetical protein